MESINVIVIDEIGQLKRVCDAIGRSGWVQCHKIKGGKLDYPTAAKVLTGKISSAQVIQLAGMRSNQRRELK